MSETQTQVICPYCGHSQGEATRCESCRGLFEPLSRQATQNAMGPWFIRDEAQPFRPGCSYETLVRLIERGRVTAETIVRGPTTHQFWTRTDHAPGLSHLMGRCHACGEAVGKGDVCCEFCGAMFAPEHQRQSLGLLPVRDLEAMAGARRAAPEAHRDMQLASVGYDRLRAAVEAAAAPAEDGAPTSLLAAGDDASDLAAAVASAARQPHRRRVRPEEITSDQLAAEQRHRERRMFMIQASVAGLTILVAAAVLLWVLVKAGALALPFHVPGTGDGGALTTPSTEPGESNAAAAPETNPAEEDTAEEAGEPAPGQPPPLAAAEPNAEHQALLDLYSEAVQLAEGTTIAELEEAQALLDRVFTELPSDLHPEDLPAQQRKVARRLERLRADPTDG